MANGPMDVWVFGLIDECLLRKVDFCLRRFKGECIIIVINFDGVRTLDGFNDE